MDVMAITGRNCSWIDMLTSNIQGYSNTVDHSLLLAYMLDPVN